MTCQHLTITRWVFEDGQPADLWACVECKHRFEPLKPAPTFTTGHCHHAKSRAGCPLHNLECGYPACDRRPVA